MKRVVGPTPIDHTSIRFVGPPDPTRTWSHPDLIPFGSLLPLSGAEVWSALRRRGREREARTVIVSVAISAAVLGLQLALLVLLSTWLRCWCGVRVVSVVLGVSVVDGCQRGVSVSGIPLPGVGRRSARILVCFLIVRRGSVFIWK